MTHISLLLTLMALLAGAVSAVLLLQGWLKDRQTWRSALLRYAITFNAVLLITGMAQYSCTNIAGSCVAFSRMTAAPWMQVVSLMLSLLMQQSMAAALAGLLWVPAPRWLQPALWGVLFLVMIGVVFFYAWMPYQVRLFHALLAGYYWLMLLFSAVMLLKGLLNKNHAMFKPGLFLGAAYLMLTVGPGLASSLPAEQRQWIYPVAAVITNGILILWMLLFGRPDKAAWKHEVPISGALPLSSREKEIVRLVVAGKSNKEIEQQLFLSHHTVKNHLYRIYQKCGVNSRTQLISVVMGNGHGAGQ